MYKSLSKEAISRAILERFDFSPELAEEVVAAVWHSDGCYNEICEECLDMEQAYFLTVDWCNVLDQTQDSLGDLLSQHALSSGQVDDECVGRLSSQRHEGRGGRPGDE